MQHSIGPIITSISIPGGYGHTTPSIAGASPTEATSYGSSSAGRTHSQIRAATLEATIRSMGAADSAIGLFKETVVDRAGWRVDRARVMRESVRPKESGRAEHQNRG
jgi:hypothetical protein